MKSTLFVPGDDEDVTFEFDRAGPELAIQVGGPPPVGMDSLLGRAGVLNHFGVLFDVEISQYRVEADSQGNKVFRVYAELKGRRLTEGRG